MYTVTQQIADKHVLNALGCAWHDLAMEVADTYGEEHELTQAWDRVLVALTELERLQRALSSAQAWYIND